MSDDEYFDAETGSNPPNDDDDLPPPLETFDIKDQPKSIPSFNPITSSLPKEQSLANKPTEETKRSDDAKHDEDEDDDLPPLDSLDQIVESAMNTTVKLTWIERGDGWRTPQLRDEVTILYQLCEDKEETSIAFTKEKAQQAMFIYGEDSIIPGAEHILPKMKVNSVVLATIPASIVGPEFSFPKKELKLRIKLLHFTKIEKLGHGGSLVKRILKHGNQFIKLKSYDEISFHLDVADKENNILFSSRTSAKPLESYVGDPSFGHGLNTLLTTMMNEECAQLNCSASLSRPEDLKHQKEEYVYKLELISWFEVTDVKENGNILKRVLKDGTGSTKAKDGSIVKANIVTKSLEGVEFFSTQTTESPLQFTLGHGYVPEALDYIVETMKIGEISLTKVKKGQLADVASYDLKFAPATLPDILVFQVEVLEVTPEDFSWLTSYEKKMECGVQIKDVGNRLFKLKRLQGAKKKYESALEVFRYETDLTSEIQDKVKTLIRVPCELNLSLIYYKLGDLKESITRATNVIGLDSKNTKAYFRRAKAYADRGDIDQAEEDFKRALELDPTSKDINTEYTAFKKVVHAHRNQQKQLFTKMFK
eukprot:TRINITY_DN8618_c0_g1_i1.p1 TRINITY_DN8618_c0_g1~~TRINITY_DN8618_c0_g1_i1.p1  ORF type:complete len:593 (-),score=143.89 TRINITY_DN8618_c0_g1_i1:230-2008(-)